MAFCSDSKPINQIILRIFLLLFGVFESSVCFSKERMVRFGLIESEYPPYLMNTEKGGYGILGDTFVEISKAIGYSPEIIVLPKKRIDKFIEKGLIDAIAGAVEWDGDPAGKVWTDGIIRASDNVVMIKDRHPEILNPHELKDKQVALMRGYKYPSLDKMISDKSLFVIRTRSFKSLLKLIELGRVEYGVLDRNVANWVIRNKKIILSKPLHFVTPGFDEVDLRVILYSDKWNHFITQFNAALAQYKTNGKLGKILNKYR